MADKEIIVPGGGIIQDTEEGSEVIIPGGGIYQQQEAVAGWTHKWNGIAGANIAKINGVPIANIAKINGI